MRVAPHTRLRLDTDVAIVRRLVSDGRALGGRRFGGDVGVVSRSGLRSGSASGASACADFLGGRHSRLSVASAELSNLNQHPKMKGRRHGRYRCPNRPPPRLRARTRQRLTATTSERSPCRNSAICTLWTPAHLSPGRHAMYPANGRGWFRLAMLGDLTDVQSRLRAAYAGVPGFSRLADLLSRLQSGLLNTAAGDTTLTAISAIAQATTYPR